MGRIRTQSANEIDTHTNIPSDTYLQEDERDNGNVSAEAAWESVRETPPGGEKDMPGAAEELHVSEGGWGWVCVAAISLLGLLTRGTTSSFALIYLQLRLKFGSTASQTGWSYTFYTMTSMCFTPVVAALCRRYSCRRVAFCGGVLYCLGVTLSGFSTSLSMSYVTFAIAGLGGGMSTTPGPIVLNYYFSKKRSLAMALALIFNGIGGAIYAPLVSYLFVYYGFTGTMMIIGALLLHTLCVSLVYVIPRRFALLHRGLADDSGERKPGETAADVAAAQKADAPGPAAAADGNRHRDDAGRASARVTQPAVAGDEPALSRGEDLARSSGDGSGDDAGGVAGVNKQAAASAVIRERAEGRTTLSGKLVNMRRKLQSCQLNINTSILRRRGFALYCLMMWTYSLAMSMNSVVVADFFAGRRMSTYQIAALLSIYSAISVPARLVIGVTCDLPRMRRLRTLVFGVVVCCMGFCLVLGPLTDSVPSTFAWYAIFGLFGAVASTQEAVVIADLVGARNFPDGVGISKFGRGFGILLGPTVGGLLADKTGSYSATYICAGILLMITSTIFWVNILLENRNTRRLEKSKESGKPVC